MAKKRSAAKGKRPAGKAAPTSNRSTSKGKSVPAGKEKKVPGSKGSARKVGGKKVASPPARTKRPADKAKGGAKKTVGKKPVVKKPAVKKVVAKKSKLKEPGTNRGAVKKSAGKKASVKKASVKKAAVKKVAVKKVAVKKVVAKKEAPKKTVIKRAPARKVDKEKVVTAPKAMEKRVATTSADPRVPAPKSGSAPVDRAALNKKKQDKEKVVMEFYMHSSPTALYELISTPSGFAEWYCQDVDVRDDQYTFIFGEEEREETTLIGKKLGEVIRFRRNDEEDYTFFEFRVRIDAMTNEVALVVTDHVLPEEVEATRNLWSAQIHDLMRVLGA